MQTNSTKAIDANHSNDEDIKEIFKENGLSISFLDRSSQGIIDDSSLSVSSRKSQDCSVDSNNLLCNEDSSTLFVEPKEAIQQEDGDESSKVTLKHIPLQEKALSSEKATSCRDKSVVVQIMKSRLINSAE
jgi:hypothetical protein